MNRRSPSKIKCLKWRVEWLAQVSAEAIITRLPATLAFRLGECIGRLLWHLMPQRRRIVFKNLRIALAGEKSLDEIRDLARESFIRSVANLVSAVHTAHMPAHVLESRVTVENPEVLEAAVRDGRGCLLLPPHMGNWEILSRIKHLFPPGHELGALYRPLNNPYLDARLAKKRQSEGTRMFSKRDSLLEITRFLKAGGIIGVLADQRAGYQGSLTNFFGRLTRATSLPSILIRRCKVPAFAISVRTLSPGKWALKYHPVAKSGDLVASINAIERAMGESMVDVFWFQDRWKCYFSKKRTLRDWLGGGDLTSTRRPHRALVWLVNPPSDWEPPAAWLHPDLRYEIALAKGSDIPRWAGPSSVIHRVEGGNDFESFRGVLLRIDESTALPLDFILSPCVNRTLRKAATRELLNYVLAAKP